MLLKKGLVIVPALIFTVALFSNNTLYAESILGTKERIKEIKIIEDINIEKLIRSNRTKIASISFSNYTRDINVTARNLENERITIENSDENENNKEEAVKNNTKTNTNTEKTKKQETKKVSTKVTKTTKKEEKKEKTSKKEEKDTVVVKNKDNELNTEKEIEQKTESKTTEKIKVSISRNMDLTKRTGLSKEQFKELVKHVSQDTSKFFYNNADYIYDLCEKYQINEIFFCGLISAESGWNIASNHRRTHNYISLMSGGKLIPFASVKEGLTAAAKALHNNYLTPGGRFYGGKTLAGVQKKFCPSGSWISLVYGRMSQMAAAAKKVK